MPGTAAAIGAVVTFGLASGATAAFIGNAVLLLGSSAALNKLTQEKFKTGIAPRDIIIRSGAQPKMVVYGEAVTAGVLAYMNQVPIGNDDFELWAVFAHAGHESEELQDLFYGTDELLSGVDLNWVSDEADVDTTDWGYTAGDGTEATTIWRRLGTDTQTVVTDLDSAFTDITTDFRLRGITYTVHRWTLWQETEEIFKGGQPQNVRARIKGRKIYDPRLDSTRIIDSTTSPVTLGSGSQRADTESTWAWSANPVLCACDYLIKYRGFNPERFDWEWIAAQADKCEVQVVVPPSASPSNFQDRYVCNGAISLGDTHDVNLKKILSSCMGHRTTVNGKIRITVGDYQTPDVTLGESDIIGKVVVRAAVPIEDRYNKVNGRYIAEEAAYVETEYQSQESATFLSRDNNRLLNKEISLPMTTNEYAAQRIAWKWLQQSDQQLTVELPLRWSGLRLTPGSYVEVNYSKLNWAPKVFRVEAVKIQHRGGAPVIATLKEDSASSWADPAVGDYTTRTITGAVVKPTESVPAPTNLSVETQPGTAGIIVDWTAPSDSETWDAVEVFASPDSSWANAVRVSGPKTRTAPFTHLISNLADPLSPGDQRYYWVRAVRNGQYSLRDPNSDTSTVTATVPNYALPNLLPFGYSSFDPFEYDITALTFGAAAANGGAIAINSAGSHAVGRTHLEYDAISDSRMTGADSIAFSRSGEFNIKYLTADATEMQIVLYVNPNALGADYEMRWILQGASTSASSSWEVLDDIAAVTVGSYKQISFAIDVSSFSETAFRLTLELSNQNAVAASGWQNAEILVDGVMLHDTSGFNIVADVP